eukprot:7528970-Ditylum_brightwellii.AAC.1
MDDRASSFPSLPSFVTRGAISAYQLHVPHPEWPPSSTWPSLGGTIKVPCMALAVKQSPPIPLLAHDKLKSAWECYQNTPL